MTPAADEPDHRLHDDVPISPTCRTCGATPRSCDGVRWLRGRPCCPGCTHITDEETTA